MQYPFELDKFQKQAVLRLERSESVFVAAHTSAGLFSAKIKLLITNTSYSLITELFKVLFVRFNSLFLFYFKSSFTNWLAIFLPFSFYNKWLVDVVCVIKGNSNRQDCSGWVRDCAGVQAHDQGHLHQPHQGAEQPEVQRFQKDFRRCRLGHGYLLFFTMTSKLTNENHLNFIRYTWINILELQVKTTRS